MRLAFITVGDISRLTGGYLYNARLISGLREGGMEVEEIVASGASPIEQEAASARFGTDFESARFDVIVVDALARLVCAPHLDRWRKAAPVVALVHELPSVAAGSLSPDPAEEPLLRADLLVAVSHHGKSVLEQRGVPEKRIHVVPPGFDRLRTAGRSFTRRGSTLHALCVSQWIERKGILELVRAWKARKEPDAELVLIGETDADPDYAKRVRGLIRDDPSVTVAGPVDDHALLEAYSSADLFVLPSRYEGYGMVYAEALSFGLPVIACEVGPVPELVGRKAALPVPPEDVNALSAALDRLLGDRDLRSRMSAAARSRARNLPRWEDTVRLFRDALREIVFA